MSERREFLKQLGAAISAICMGNSLTMLTGCEMPATPKPSSHGLKVIDVSKLSRDNTAFVERSIMPEGAPLLIVRHKEGAFEALSMKCTHMGCTVNPPVGDTITCPCHGSQYDLNGKVLQGPAPEPLHSYKVSFDQALTQVTVTY